MDKTLREDVAEIITDACMSFAPPDVEDELSHWTAVGYYATDRIITLIAAARPAVVSDEVVEVTDRKSQWMLENSEGRWLHNAEDGTFTSDPNLGLKWPNRTAADAFRLSLRGPLWALKLTEHVWIEPDPYDWTDAEDDIADAISVGARDLINHFYSVLRLSEKRALFEKHGLTIGDAATPDGERWNAGFMEAKERGLLLTLARDMARFPRHPTVPTRTPPARTISPGRNKIPPHHPKGPSP